ncbi:MAG: hypothetical protein WCI18_17450, partial [Pseudomonadota bacterium]
MFKISVKALPAIGAMGLLTIAACKSTITNDTQLKIEQGSALVPKRPLGKEADDLYREPDEEANIKKIADINISMISTNQRHDKTTFLGRSAHTKGHGCMRGVFEVDPSLSEEYSVGVFQPGARYGAWARLSTGSPGTGSDTAPGSRCLAFKLINVQSILSAFPNLPASEKLPLLPERQGLGQDFLFLNTPNFLVSNLSTYVKVNSGIEHKSPLEMFHAFFSADPKDPAFRPNEALNFGKITLQPVANPLALHWFGQLPYKWKDTAFKYRLDRCDPKDSNPARRVVERGPEQLEEATKSVLADSDVCYSFSVILQYDNDIQPIADSTVEWLSDDASIRA